MEQSFKPVMLSMTEAMVQLTPEMQGALQACVFKNIEALKLGDGAARPPLDLFRREAVLGRTA